VLDALDMALATRRPNGVIHHSDQGSQYTSIEFGQRCREAGVRPSMGSVGDAYDNAMCESFFAMLECELLARHRFKNQAGARMAVFAFIEGFYNRRRRHSAIGYLSPVDYEHRQAFRPEP
jgi:putative transposase